MLHNHAALPSQLGALPYLSWPPDSYLGDPQMVNSAARASRCHSNCLRNQREEEEEEEDKENTSAANHSEEEKEELKNPPPPPRARTSPDKDEGDLLFLE